MLVGLVLLAHALLLGVWWQQRVEALPATAQPPANPTAMAAPTPTATELGTVRTAPAAAPSDTAKTEQKQAAALDRKQPQAIKPANIATTQTTPTTPVAQAEAMPAPATPAPTPTNTGAPEQTPHNSADTTPPGTLKWPAATELRYDVHATRKGLSLSADSVLRWQPSASAYQARLEVKALLFGQRSQTSVGTLDPAHGLQPTRYGDKNRSEQATHFDRTRTPPALRFSANTPDVPLQPHTQDRLSVLLQLAAMFAGEPGRFGPGDTVALHTAGPRDADVWRFQVGATAPLALPVGTLDTVHLVRAPQHPYDNRVELWLAPGLGYVPVRILWTQANGDVVDQRLASHSP